MPQVPGLTPSVSPSLGGAPELSLPVPVDAFGGAVGKALEGLGGAIEGASDKIWSRAMEMQNLQNETQAKEADAKYMMESGKMHAEFINKEGQNAGPEALAKHIQDLQDLRVSTRSGLNPMAAKMYDASSLSFMGRNIFNAAGHSGQQMKVSANNAADARIDTASNNIGENPRDDIGYQRGKRVIESEIDRKADLGGWTPEQTEASKLNAVSAASAKRIVGLARTDAIGAKSMFDAASKSGALSPVDASKVEATVQSQFRLQGSRIISDKTLGGLRSGDETDKTEQDYIDTGVKEAEDTAKRFGIEDPLFKDFVRDRISADYRRQKTVERDGAQAAEQTVMAAMQTGNKEGILPKSLDELKLINPEVASAWDHMKPTVQQKYFGLFKQNAAGEKVVWNQDNLKTFQQLRGMKLDNPVEFLAHDFTNDKLPPSGILELVRMQQSLKSQADADPRVGRAMQILAPDLHAAGIDKTATNKDDYYQFVGSLQDQLDQFQKDHKKVPTMEEVRSIGAKLMQEQVTGRARFLGMGTEKTPAYQLPVPDEEITRLRNDPYWAAHNIQPNDQMISRIYRAQKFKELYGGAAKKPAEASFPPNG